MLQQLPWQLVVQMEAWAAQRDLSVDVNTVEQNQLF